MYHPDLSPWNGFPSDAEVKCVGWLGKDHPFQTGALAQNAITVLRVYVKEAVSFWMACGHHRCEFCPATGPWTLDNTSNREIWVPTSRCIYVAPTLILH
jgi:hypothetical protein